MSTAFNKKFFSYVIPSILAFALSGVYTIVDGFFVGRSLGDAGLAAITLGYPISALVGAIGTGLGLSGAIRFTILNAQGETQKRQECFSGTAVLMLIASGLLTAILFGFAKPILHLLGARGDTLTLCIEYVRVIALGAVFQLLATGFVPFIRNMGGASVAMIAMILGFVTNIVLDYTFVWILNRGMEGAAWATIIGQAVTLIAAVIFFIVDRRCDHGSLHDRCLPCKSKSWCPVWRFGRSKCRSCAVSSVFPCNTSVFGIRPHYDLLLLRNGKEQTVLSSRICRAGLYAADAPIPAANAEADRRMACCADCTGRYLCNCMGRQAACRCENLKYVAELFMKMLKRNWQNTYSVLRYMWQNTGGVLMNKRLPVRIWIAVVHHQKALKTLALTVIRN